MAVYFSFIISCFAQTTYYHNNFEEKNDLIPRLDSSKVKLDAIGLSDNDPHGGRKCGRMAFDFLNTIGGADVKSYRGSANATFTLKLPVPVELETGKEYAASAALKISNSNNLNLRISYDVSWSLEIPGEGKKIKGMAAVQEKIRSGRDEWLVFQLPDEMSALIREDLPEYGLPSDTNAKITVDGLEIMVICKGRGGNGLTVYVDDVSLREADETDREYWLKMRKPVDFTMRAYPQVENFCPWGACGGLAQHDDFLNISKQLLMDLSARMLAELGMNTSLYGVYEFYPDSTMEEESRLGQLLDFCAQNDLKVIPKTYLLDNYHHVSRAQSEDAIKRIVSRYRHHPALLAWWMIDEPEPDLESLRDYWVCGKERFESLDDNHPAMGAACTRKAVKMYAPYMQVVVIDCYPLRGTTNNPSGSALQVAYWAELAWKYGARRIWAVPQAFGGDYGPWRAPTREELRLMTYLNLSRGVTGFMYYPWTPGMMDVCYFLTDLGEEVRKLSEIVPAMCPLFLDVKWNPKTSAHVECGQLEGRPVFEVSELNGHDYDLVVICNLDTKCARKGKIILPAGMRWPAYDLMKLRRLGGERNISLELEPGGCAVFLLGNDNTFEKARAKILAGKLAVEKRRLAGLAKEAEANGINTKGIMSGINAITGKGRTGRWRDAPAVRRLMIALKIAKKQDQAELALKKTLEAEEKLNLALRGIPSYSACWPAFEKGSRILSKTHAKMMNEWIPRKYPDYRSFDMRPALAKDTEYQKYFAVFQKLCNIQHFIRYLLLTGRTNDELVKESGEFLTRAETLEKAVENFVDGSEPLNIDMESITRQYKRMRNTIENK